MTRIINTNLYFFCLCRTLGSDDYNDVRLGGHGTLHGYSNCVNPFLEVNSIFNLTNSISIVCLFYRFLIRAKLLNTCRLIKNAYRIIYF
jgi:hypothetical protein